MGNLLNFDFGDANYATNVYQYDTLYAKLSLTNGEVDLSQLAVTYSNALDAILDVYHNIDLPEKSVFAISCRFNELEGKDNDTINVLIVVATRGYLESRYGQDTNDWRAGNRAGRCDGYLEGFWGGPEEVSYMLNQHVIDDIPGCLFGDRVYFTDEGGAWKSSNNDPDMVAPNSPRGYRLFYETDFSGNGAINLPNTCLTHSEIMYYYNQCKYIFQNFKSTFSVPIPNNHVALYYNIEYKHSLNHCAAWWQLDVTHAKPNCTSSSPNV